MTTELLERPPGPVEPPASVDPISPRRTGGGVRRFWRGRHQDPAWVRPALLTLLVVTAGLYLWDLGASGWANSFYSAAVQAGTKSWKAFFFGSSDSSNFITVDKPPAALWVMEISARIFGVNAWSILVPQAIEGVATVGLVYLTVRRWFSAQAALLSGLVVALTPVAALMFRYNNPDALLALLLTGAAYATVRALERGRTKWLVLAATLIGFGFITKMMQAVLVVPAIGVVYLLAAPVPFWRRVIQLLAGGLALFVSAGWWVASVVLTPAADRPYVGGSQNNNLVSLIFDYNGFGRLTGNETGSVGGGPASGSMWGPTGWNRLFLSTMGGQVSWLVPAALVLLVAALWFTRRAPRTDRTRAAFVLWGLTLLGIGLTISYAQGIIHPYYTVALAPATGALVGMGAAVLWGRRSKFSARVFLALAVGVTSWWSFVLLDRSPTWLPGLRVAVVAAGAIAALGILLLPVLRRSGGVVCAVLALAVALAGPLAYTLDTVRTPHSGAIPSAGPPVATAGFGPGGFGAPRGFSGSGRLGGFGGRGRAGGTGGRGFSGGAQGFTPPVGGPTGGFTPPAAGALAGGGVPGASGRAGTLPKPSGRGFPGGFANVRGGGLAAGAAGGPGGAGGAGGLLNASTPGHQVVKLLQANAGKYTWVAATVSSETASGYQLSTDDPVMAIGGFNGNDPAPSLAEFKRDVSEKKIHYFIASGGGFGGGGFGGGGGTGGAVGARAPGQGNTGSDASSITSWVESHFTAKTVDGITVYDLTKSVTG